MVTNRLVLARFLMERRQALIMTRKKWRKESMEAIRRHEVVKKDGEICVTGLPCKKGQDVEIIVLLEPSAGSRRRSLTARQLLQSGLIGLWKDRTDIQDSAAYARQLREQAQGGMNDGRHTVYR
jgi:hypothetical protein